MQGADDKTRQERRDGGITKLTRGDMMAMKTLVADAAP